MYILQGGILHSAVTLADPVIHSMTPGYYGFTNHGPNGKEIFQGTQVWQYLHPDGLK